MVKGMVKSLGNDDHECSAPLRCPGGRLMVLLRFCSLKMRVSQSDMTLASST